MKSRVSPISLIICLVIMMAVKASCSPWTLQCRCIKTIKICPKNIAKFEVLHPGSHCSRLQIIATQKNGQQWCLQPDSPKVQRCIQYANAQNKTTFYP